MSKRPRSPVRTEARLTILTILRDQRPMALTDIAAFAVPTMPTIRRELFEMEIERLVHIKRGAVRIGTTHGHLYSLTAKGLDLASQSPAATLRQGARLTDGQIEALHDWRPLLLQGPQSFAALTAASHGTAKGTAAVAGSLVLRGVLSRTGHAVVALTDLGRELSADLPSLDEVGASSIDREEERRLAGLRRLANPDCTRGCNGDGYIADLKTDTRTPCACTQDANAGHRPRVRMAVRHMHGGTHAMVALESQAIGRY